MINAVVWTALHSNFKKQINSKKDYDVKHAIDYLKTLPENAKKNALNYIKKAPRQVITPLRTEIRKLHYLKNIKNL